VRTTDQETISPLLPAAMQSAFRLVFITFPLPSSPPRCSRRLFARKSFCIPSFAGGRVADLLEPDGLPRPNDHDDLFLSLLGLLIDVSYLTFFPGLATASAMISCAICEKV